MGAKLVASLPLKSTLSEEQKISLYSAVDEALDSATEDYTVTRQVFKLQADIGHVKARRKTGGRSTRTAAANVSYIEISDDEDDEEDVDDDESNDSEKVKEARRKTGGRSTRTAAANVSYIEISDDDEDEEEEDEEVDDDESNESES
jgi:hypothetical protein